MKEYKRFVGGSQKEISFPGVANAHKMYQAKKKERSDKKLAEEAEQKEKAKAERKRTETIKKADRTRDNLNEKER